MPFLTRVCFLSDRAVGAFLETKDLIEELLQEKPLDLSFRGVDHFRNQVGFVKLAESDHEATLIKISGNPLISLLSVRKANLAAYSYATLLVLQCSVPA